MRNYGKISEARLQLENLDLGKHGSEITEYDRGYITDIYMEIADSNTSIYYSDTEKYLVDNVDVVNDWIAENGYPGDLYEAAQAAEYDSIYNDLLEHSDNILLYWAYTYMHDTYGDEAPVYEALDIGYLYSELSLDVARLESIGGQVDKLAMDLLDARYEEEQE